GNTCRPIAHAKEDVAIDLFPVEQDGLFQPGLAVQRRQNPIMPLKHLAANLRIAWLVGAGQTQGAKAKEEEERTDTQQHCKLQDEKSCPRTHEWAPAARSVVGRTVSALHRKFRAQLAQHDFFGLGQWAGNREAAGASVASSAELLSHF